MKSESIDDVHNNLSDEPLKINNIQDYNITELSNLFRDKEGSLNGSQRIGKADILDYLLVVLHLHK